MVDRADAGSRVPGRVLGARFHGRGGQGVLALAEGLALAAVLEGRVARAYSVGAQRTGAPIVCCARIDDAELGPLPLADPHVVVVRDLTVMAVTDVLAGLRPGGYLLLDSPHRPDALGLGAVADALPAGHVAAVPATDLAMARFGTALPNAALLGAFAALTGWVSLDSVRAAIAARTSRRGARVATAVAEDAHAHVLGRLEPTG